MLKNSKIKIVSIVPRLQARLVSVMPSYSIPKIVSIKANSIGHGIKPTFTRTSTAYKSDGSVVNAGVPRIEAGKGVLVEEGTTNLLTANNQAFYNASGYTTSGQQDMSGGNTAYLLTDSNISANSQISLAYVSVLANTTSYSLSVYLKQGTASQTLINLHLTGGTAQYNDIILTWATKTTSKGTLVNVSGDWYKLTFTIANNGTNTLLTSRIFPASYSANGSTVGNVYAWHPQIEAKAYPTTFTPTTRNAESLAVPASTLSASEGTIEFDVVFNLASYVGLSYRNIIDIGNTSSGGRITIYIEPADGSIRLQSCYGGASYETKTSGIIPANATKYRFAISFKDKVKLYINGILKCTSVNNHSLNITRDTTLGSSYTLTDITKSNAYFSNLRISNKARTDAELANTGALTVDEYTTYFAPMTTDLKAYTKGNGNATLKSIAC